MPGDSEARWELFWKALWWVAFPPFAAFIIVLAARDVGPAVAAIRGTGTPGTFTATVHVCAHCGWKGDYVSDDGLHVRRHVTLDGDSADVSHPGDRIRAWDTGAHDEVYADHHSGTAAVGMLMLLVVVAAAPLWLWTATRRLLTLTRRLTSVPSPKA